MQPTPITVTSTLTVTIPLGPTTALVIQDTPEMEQHVKVNENKRAHHNIFALAKWNRIYMIKCPIFSNALLRAESVSISLVCVKPWKFLQPAVATFTKFNIMSQIGLFWSSCQIHIKRNTMSLFSRSISNGIFFNCGRNNKSDWFDNWIGKLVSNTDHEVSTNCLTVSFIHKPLVRAT